jgi:hypothetical protein
MELISSSLSVQGLKTEAADKEYSILSSFPAAYDEIRFSPRPSRKRNKLRVPLAPLAYAPARALQSHIQISLLQHLHRPRLVRDSRSTRNADLGSSTRARHRLEYGDAQEGSETPRRGEACQPVGFANVPLRSVFTGLGTSEVKAKVMLPESKWTIQ